uniref:Erythronate-4-phosphate dehydrogenase family protein n=1 Tax=Oryza punctata TaxID=4537 RepID=A0A0E0KJM1_ORYPU
MADEVAFETARKIIMHPLYTPRSSPWLDLKVFYVRVSNCEVDESAPDRLTLNHIPLSPDTVIEVNGQRSSMHTEFISSSLRRDRVDKMTEEATFVSTDSIRMTGSVRFQVFDKNDLLLTGDLELCSANGVVGESKNSSKRWNMKCQPASSCNGFLKGKPSTGSESVHPVIEVYLAGTFCGTPIILTKTVQHISRRKSQMKLKLDSIPENEATEQQKEELNEDSLQVSELQNHKSETDVDVDYNSLYSRQDFIEGEDGELSWFNAGVRVGVGIGLGICVGVGLGVGLLVRTYQSTSRNFRRRLP